MSLATPGYDLRRVQGTDGECAPSYLTMDPDTGPLYLFSVVVQPETGPSRGLEFRFPVGARCAEARNALLTVLHLTRLPPGWAVTVGTCH